MQLWIARKTDICFLSMLNRRHTVTTQMICPVRFSSTSKCGKHNFSVKFNTTFFYRLTRKRKVTIIKSISAKLLVYNSYLRLMITVHPYCSNFNLASTTHTGFFYQRATHSFYICTSIFTTYATISTHI